MLKQIISESVKLSIYLPNKKRLIQGVLVGIVGR